MATKQYEAADMSDDLVLSHAQDWALCAHTNPAAHVLQRASRKRLQPPADATLHLTLLLSLSGTHPCSLCAQCDGAFWVLPFTGC